MTDKQKILILDDDQYILNVYKHLLVSCGFEVDTAGNGVDGLQLIQKGGYSLILTDAMMPKMDGLTLLNHMKTMQPEVPNGPVVVCTNLAGDTIIEQSLAAGAKACLIKTEVNSEQFIEKVKGYLLS